jgi:hypothetical protein
VTTNYSLIGAMGPDVANVSVDLSDGTTVTATLHADYWAAWWPGRASTARVDTLTVRTKHGSSYELDPRGVQLPWARYGATAQWP